MGLSQKTIDEMAAGQRALALQSKRLTGPQIALLDKAVATQERMKLLRQWECEGKVQLGTTRRYTNDGQPWQREVRVMAENKFVDGGQVEIECFTEEDYGGYPSEVLIAKIAMALQAHGEL